MVKDLWINNSHLQIDHSLSPTASLSHSLSDSAITFSFPSCYPLMLSSIRHPPSTLPISHPPLSHIIILCLTPLCLLPPLPVEGGRPEPWNTSKPCVRSLGMGGLNILPGVVALLLDTAQTDTVTPTPTPPPHTHTHTHTHTHSD